MFPGVVPRSFIGPVVVSGIAAPWVQLSTLVGANKFFHQYIVRACLGLCVAVSFLQFCRAVQKKFGRSVKLWLILTTVTQFHFMFYMSRSLPNVFALALVLQALSRWLKQEHNRFLWLSGAAIIIFRSELSLFLGLILISELFNGRLSLKKLFLTGIPAGVCLLGLTVLVDSFFWQRWLWPEGEVLWFNTIRNKSSHWGTESFHWYFSSVLPRALSLSIVLIPVGLYFRRQVWTLLWPALGFVFLYSFLPHKELRFIVYVFPVLNVAIACALSRLWQNKSKSLYQCFMAIAGIGVLCGNMMSTSGFLYISYHNYAGGVAMRTLHHLEKDRAVSVHIDVYTAQTGVTRFTQLNDNWSYIKTEDLPPGGKEINQFSHLMIRASKEDDKSLKPYKDTHTELTRISGFEGIKMSLRKFPPIQVITSPKIWILKRKAK